MEVKPIVFDKFAFQKVRSIFDKNNCSNHFKIFAASKVSIKYVESGTVCDNFEKLQEYQAQRTIDRVYVARGYFTETAPHISSLKKYDVIFDETHYSK